jgi:hypothetical protein
VRACEICPARLEEIGHHLVWQPCRRVKAWCRTQGSQAVRAADQFGSRKSAAESVTDDGSHLLDLRAGEPLLLAALTGTAVMNGDGPVIEQITADGELVAAVMVLLSVVSFLCPVPDNAESAPAGSKFPGPARVTAAHNRITAPPGST